MGARTQWRPFLELWSQEWIAGHDPVNDRPLAEEVVRDGWLGFGPAAEAEIAVAEARLGCRLPPSLREFLLVTDGWRDAGNFVYRVAGSAELAWLRDTDDRSWIEVYEDLAEDGDDEDDDGDDGDDFGVQEARMLGRALRLSLEGDAAVMLLDPGDVDEDGEWAGYWLASWSGEGPERHDSFHDLMRRQWRSFHALTRPPGTTRDHWDAQVEQARREALSGGIDGPLAVLAEAHEFGSDRADLLSAQLRVLLGGDWEREIASLLWYTPRTEHLLHGPLFAEELLPLLVRQDQLVHRHGLRPLPRLKQYAPEAVRTLVADYEARAAAPGFRPAFGGGAAFDAAVRAVVEPLAAHPAFLAPDGHPSPADHRVVVRHSDNRPAPAADPLSDPRQVRALRAALCDDAWPALLAALPLWRPVSADHIAPISLLADPVLAQMLTRERGRELLSTARGEPS